jgi:hypothetical protein
MMRSADAVHRHAQELVEWELRRAHRSLQALQPERRRAVEQAVATVASALAQGLVDGARREPEVARALVSIYAAEAVWERPALPCPSD